MKGLKRNNSQVKLKFETASKKNKVIQRKGIMLYLDMLPENAIENIVRFLSACPRMKDWSSQISIDDISPLYRVGGELSAFLLARFNALCIADLADFSFEAVVYRWKRSVFHVLWTQDVATARNLLENIIYSHTPNISNVSNVVFDTLTIRDPSADLSFLYNDRYTRVRSLSVVKYGAELVKKFSRHLEVLQVGIFAPINAIESHCFNIRELVLNELNAEDMPAGNNLWRHLGTTLESLSIEAFFPFAAEIKKIQKYCRKLTSIHIDQLAPEYYSDYEEDFLSEDGDVFENGILALAVALASYGDQLESASVRDMAPDEVQLIVDACANVKVSLSINEEENALNSLKTLGSLIDKIDYRLDEYASVDLTQAWSKCENLRQLRMQSFLPIPDAAIRQITACPKYLLKSIRISSLEATDFADCMNAIADSSGALENINFGLNNFTVTKSGVSAVFERIVKRNKHLSAVTILVRKYADTSGVAESTNTIAGIVESFIKSPQIRSIKADDNTSAARAVSIPAIEEICRPYRHRRVSIRALGFYYLL